MPNQEVYNCQAFSELCTRADLILSSSSKPQEMETSLLFHWVGRRFFLLFLILKKTLWMTPWYLSGGGALFMFTPI